MSAISSRLIAAVWLLALWVGLCPPLAAAAPSGWRAVLVAGDNAEPVFDNAVAAFRDWLVAGGVPPRNIQVLSATPGREGGVEPASTERVLGRIAALRPGPGEGCLVFITSHGERGEGIRLAYQEEFLRPIELGRALSAGCGRAPSVVIVSGCYTGGFTVLRAPNRIVVTAARADRPSFGCAVTRTYAVFDECLLTALPQAATWRAVVAATRRCVGGREQQLRATPSEPQAAFGARVRDLRVR
jgi:hypothetical protein